MGINIGICELEAENAKCRPYKQRIVKVHVNDVAGFEEAADVDEFVTLEDAKAIFPDFESFIKRNRINAESDAIYIEKVKVDEDIEKLKVKVQRRYTGWLRMDDLDDQKKAKALELSNPEDRLTGWDMVDFEAMNGMCASCPLSWDKGRGCIGAFGPDNSLLPQVAEKRNCRIVASAPVSAKEQKRFSPEEAEELLKEIEILRAALPEEGKLYVKRYTGPLDRMEAVGKACVSEKCGFFFF